MLYGCRGIAADCCCPIETNSGTYIEYSGSHHINSDSPPHMTSVLYYDSSDTAAGCL